MRCARALALAVACSTSSACEDVIGIDTSRYVVGAGPGACQGTIHVRVLYDMTGPTADVSTDGGKGVTDYLRDLNDAGGLRGCPIAFELGDSKYDPAATLAVYQAWQAEPDWPLVSVIFAGGTPMTQVIGPLAAQDGKVLVTNAYAGELASPLPVSHDVGVPSLSDAFVAATVQEKKSSPGYPLVFFPGTDYTTSARIAAYYVWQRGAKRVAFVYCSTSAFCTDPVDGAKTFLASLGGTQIGRDLHVELTDDDAQVGQKVATFFQQEADHRAADPSYAPVDWIWFGNTRASLASLGRALAGRSGAPSVITDTFGLDEALYAACGDACVGMLGVQPLPVYDDPSVSGMPRLTSVHDRYRAIDGDPPQLHATAEYVAGFVAAAAWRAAAESVLDGGLPLTGDNLRAALETFQSRPIETFASLSFSPTDHRPQSTSRVYQLAPSGKLASMGQPVSIALQPDWLGW